MFFSILFDKYYQQIEFALLINYKKAVGKIHVADITKSLEKIKASEFKPAREKSNSLVQKFNAEYQVTFKPLALPVDILKEKIKHEIEKEWSEFFKNMSILIDNHDFYKAIEDRFKLVYEEIVNATRILARDLSLISEVQEVYTQLINVGKSREALIINLEYIAEKTKEIFTNYYQKVNSLREQVEKYSEQTITQFFKYKEELCLQVEELISEEKSAQSEYHQFFLNYRLSIAHRVDLVIDHLKTFNFKATEMRLEFIQQLTILENKRPEKLSQYCSHLDYQFENLLQSITQMQQVEKTEQEVCKIIDEIAKSSHFNFFEEVAEEAKQIAIGSIINCLRETTSLSLIIQELNTIKQQYCDKINQIMAVENQYLQLKQNVVSNLDSNIKFSLNLLKLNAETIVNLFLPNTSYRLIKGELSKPNNVANQTLVNQLTTEGILLSLSSLGEEQKYPVNLKGYLSLEQVAEELSNNIQQMGHSNLVSFIPILADETEQQDIPAFLLFCRDIEQSRPELTIYLEIQQQGEWIYVRKFINITPLPSQVLNDLLDSYKVAFRHQISEVKNLISDEFLANKLKLDFQGEMARVMTQVKKQLKIAYFEELKQYVLNLAQQGNLEEKLFFKTVDYLITNTLNNLFSFSKL